jgi:hypothetical protein
MLKLHFFMKSLRIPEAVILERIDNTMVNRKKPTIAVKKLHGKLNIKQDERTANGR